MSQLNVDTIKDKSGVDQPDIVGAAKAFVNFNGTGTVAVLESFNVSSITDNGVGVYTINYSTSLTSSNPTVQVTAWSDGIAAAICGYGSSNSSGVNVITTSPAGNTGYDPTDISVTIFSN